MLSGARARAQLLAAVARSDRLVLLGDVLELRERSWGEVLRIATPMLAALGEALPAAGSVVLVAGNHDHGLLVPWLQRRAVLDLAPALGVESEVTPLAGEPLGCVCAAFGGRRVDIAYPGVWLREDVYATHGHYLDRHTTVPTLERLGIGAVARIASERPDAPAAAEDYEAVLGPVYAWLDALAGAGSRTGQGASVAAWRRLGQGRGGRGGLRGRALRLSFPGIVAGLRRAGLGPLSADVSIERLRDSSLRAFAEVLLRMRVQAPFVVFGHTHRAGPLPGDDPRPWQTATGIRLINCGCWVGERALSGSRPDSPYRPGFCVRLDDDAAPALVNLLD